MKKILEYDVRRGSLGGPSIEMSSVFDRVIIPLNGLKTEWEVCSNDTAVLNALRVTYCRMVGTTFQFEADILVTGLCVGRAARVLSALLTLKVLDLPGFRDCQVRNGPHIGPNYVGEWQEQWTSRVDLRRRRVFFLVGS